MEYYRWYDQAKDITKPWLAINHRISTKINTGVLHGGQGAQPPPPPSLAQAIAALIANRNEQTELLRRLVQSNADRGRQAPLAETDYVGFLSTQPPLFHKADDPLEADAWIRTIEDKFSILNCT